MDPEGGVPAELLFEDLKPVGQGPIAGLEGEHAAVESRGQLPYLRLQAGARRFGCQQYDHPFGY